MYLSDYLFLVQFSSSLHGTCKLMSEGLQFPEDLGLLHCGDFSMYLPHWPSIRGKCIAAANLYLKDMFPSCTFGLEDLEYPGPFSCEHGLFPAPLICSNWVL